MHLRRSSSVLLAALATTCVLASAASATPPLPFGHPCEAKDGALFCPTADDAHRVAAFDGVPLDVDVWLPATGDGPFPTIAMIHGWGGNKTNFGNNADGYSAQYYARKGYAILLSTARGFGRSCGTGDSRTTPACDKGWIHLGDSRYEARDQQQLLGLLVDQGVAKVGALAATGISYGGGATLELAYLKDRIHNPDGSYAAWKSPSGTPLSLSAAWARWPWSDLADALMPNGRTFVASGNPYQFGALPGVDIEQYQNGLYGLGLANFLAPIGADRGSDLQTWKATIDKGEPYSAQARGYLKEIHTNHGAGGIPLPAGGPAPLIIQNGWTDDLFPAWQGIRPYLQIRKAAPKAQVSLQLGDLGHDRGANHPKDGAAFNAQGLALFNHFLLGKGAAPASGKVTAYGERCPKNAPSGIGPFTAPTPDALAKRPLILIPTSPVTGTVTADGGDPAIAKKLGPLGLNACTPLPAPALPAAGTVVLEAPSAGFTLAGAGEVAVEHGPATASAQLVLRLWDVNTKAGTQLLIDRSVSRFPAGKTATFHLNGNAWKFAKGHLVRLELLGRDGPAFRPSNGSFKVQIKSVTLTLPTR